MWIISILPHFVIVSCHQAVSQKNIANQVSSIGLGLYQKNWIEKKTRIEKRDQTREWLKNHAVPKEKDFFFCLILDIDEFYSIGLNGVFAVISMVALRWIEKNVLR